MPPRKTVAEEPVEETAVPSDTNEPEAPADVPETDESEPADATQPADAVEDTDAESEEAMAPDDEGGSEFGLDEGEFVIAQRTRDDAVVVAATNLGRKIEITPEGQVTVVTGPPLKSQTVPVEA